MQVLSTYFGSTYGQGVNLVQNFPDVLCIELNTRGSTAITGALWTELCGYILSLYDKCGTLLFRGKLVVFKNKFSSLAPLAMSGEARCINLCLTGSGAEALHFVSPLGRVRFSPGVC